MLPKALRKFATCLLVTKNLRGKLVLFSGLPIIFDDDLKTASISFFTADFNLLSCEFDSFTFKLFYWVILYLHQTKLFYDIFTFFTTFTVPCESRQVLASSRIKKNSCVSYTIQICSKVNLLNCFRINS